MHSNESNHVIPTAPGALLKTARNLLENVTPMHNDCGKYCGAACCKPDAEGHGGMILYPGEEVFYTACQTWATLSDCSIGEAGERYTLLTCTGQCERTMRPLACRIFPLTPVVKRGRLQVCMDVRAWPICPLMQHGMRALSPQFVQAVQASMDLIWQDESCNRYMRKLSVYLDDFTRL